MPLSALLLAAAMAALPPAPQSICLGDCNGSGSVEVSDLALGVEIGLRRQILDDCLFIDTNGDLRVSVEEIVAAVRRARNGCFGPPSAHASDPQHNQGGILRTAWLRLELLAGVEASELSGFALDCDGQGIAVSVAALDEGELIVNPAAEMPPDTECALTFTGPNGAERLAFRSAPAGAPFVAVYDRLNRRLTTPFPDDTFVVEDQTTATGVRLDVPIPDAPSDIQLIFGALLAEVNELDGFSLIAHMVVELSDAVDPASVPRTKRESLDPLATVGLFDVTPESPTYGQRLPFRIRVGDDLASNGNRSRTLILFPSIPLTPGGRYGVVVTRRAYADTSRPLEPSSYMTAVFEPPAGASDIVDVTRLALGGVLEALAAATPPIHRDDIALVLSVSVRSTEAIPRDMLAIREQIWAAAPPAYSIGTVTPQAFGDGTGAIVRGTWQAPNFRSGEFLERDAEGLPLQTGARAVPFVLVVPPQAVDAPVPVTMHQHGNPGSLEEVVGNARRFLADAGFAAIGFTDILNREIGSDIQLQTLNVLENLIQRQRMPDHWIETRAEQLAFVRLIGSLGDVDVLPLGAPDGNPDLDVGAPLTYHGISEGANNGQGLMAYAPEIRAAALVVGGARLVETLIHQVPGDFLNLLPLFFPSIAPADIWSGFSLFQAVYDVQDNHNHTPFLYRHKLPLGESTRRASLLVLEGLDDSLVPNHASDSMAYSYGPLPHVEPVQRDTVVLQTATAPIAGNIDAETTAGFYQYVPVGIEGIAPTPSCELVGQREGHFCPQVATESILQRTVFLQSAVDEAVPRIIDPLAAGGAVWVPTMADEVAGGR